MVRRNRQLQPLTRVRAESPSEPCSLSILRAQAWRGLMQRRCSQLAALLRAAERAVGDSYVGRSRTPIGVWQLLARTADGGRRVALEVEVGTVRRFADFGAPFVVAVRDPSLVEESSLRDAIRRIRVTVEWI